jgi:CheY-like chemotaxis protein
MKQPIILYVEDDLLSREVMTMLLESEIGPENLIIFENSENFEQRVQTLNPIPDLILLDVHVKPHSGFSMLQMLRSLDEFKLVPVVALTASVMSEEVHQLRTSGFSGAIAKPIDVDSFPDTIERLIKGEHIWRIV